MVTLITGASSGVGARLAERLAAAGGTVVAAARRAERLASLNPGAGRIVPLPLDVSDRAAVFSAVARIEAETGPITALVNNAAVFALEPFADQDPATIERIIAVDLLGTMWCSQAVLPGMRQRRSGRIVNIASVAGTHGLPGQAAYCAAKHGVLGFADALAQEVRADGISVSTLCPGGIDTPLWQHAADDGGVPYPGDLDAVLPVDEVCAWIEFVLERPPGTLPKRLTFFPRNEWH